MPLVGYARISTSEQDMALQLDALVKARCAQVFQDTASGAKADRPGLTAALFYARKGDVWSCRSSIASAGHCRI
jgi:DNA invertase Pin-like site-specific DNA recombinase